MVLALDHFFLRKVVFHGITFIFQEEDPFGCEAHDVVIMIFRLALAVLRDPHYFIALGLGIWLGTGHIIPVSVSIDDLSYGLVSDGLYGLLFSIIDFEVTLLVPDQEISAAGKFHVVGAVHTAAGFNRASLLLFIFADRFSPHDETY